MIFLTVGSDLPFSRLVKAADKWVEANTHTQIIAQIGKTTPEDHIPQFMDYMPVLCPEDFKSHCEKADFIIAHAGMGSIITALTIEKPIVIMPRLEKFRETRNDHQVATAEHFSTRHGIFSAASEENLPHMIEGAQDFIKTKKMKPFNRFASTDFLNKLSNFISEC